MRNFFDILGPISSFIHLSDVPTSYAGKSLQNVRCNAGETGLEFAILPPVTGNNVLGDTGTVEASSIPGGPNNIVFTKFRALSNFTATKMSLRIISYLAGGKITLGIYASHAIDNSRPDGSPIAVTNEIVSDGRVIDYYTASLVSPLTVVFDTVYWLFLFGDTANNFCNNRGVTYNDNSQWYNAMYPVLPVISSIGNAWYGNLIAAF